MVKSKRYVVVKKFQGLPKITDYKVVESELPALNSGEILLKAEAISVDPYLRAYNSAKPVPYNQFSYQVGLVVESKDPNYLPGDRVVSHEGWVDNYILNPSKPSKIPTERIYKLPDLKGLPNSLGVGALGMPGVTAYFGFLELCKPKAGETVVVSGAAGAVGSIVGQIAKIKGCRVIGFAGSDDKVKWLESIGFDKAYNYKKADIKAALKESAPNGVDCYFDNVGGEMSSIVINEMNLFGRVSVCGSISAYNEDKLPKASIIQPAALFKQLKIEGFLVPRWTVPQWIEAIGELADWVRSGKIEAKEHVTQGFDKLFDAFVGMLKGENTGKAVVLV